MKQVAGFPQRLDRLVGAGNNGSVESEEQASERNCNRPVD